MPSLIIHEHADLTLAISADGRWWVRGEPVGHPGVSRYLYSSTVTHARISPEATAVGAVSTCASGRFEIVRCGAVEP